MGGAAIITWVTDMAQVISPLFCRQNKIKENNIMGTQDDEMFFTIFTVGVIVFFIGFLILGIVSEVSDSKHNTSKHGIKIIAQTEKDRDMEIHCARGIRDGWRRETIAKECDSSVVACDLYFNKKYCPNHWMVHSYGTYSSQFNYYYP